MIFNKKAQYVEFLLIIIVLIVFGIITLFMTNIMDEFNNAIQNDNAISSDVKQDLNDFNNNYPDYFDGLILFCMIGLWIFCLAASYNSDSNALWLIVAIFVIVAVGVVSMILNNVWSSLEDDNTMQSYAADFPMTSYIFQNYLMFSVIVGFSCVLVAMYKNMGGLG